MRNHADQLTILLQPGEGLQGRVQSLSIQAAKSFIQEQGVHPHVFAGHVGQTKRQGKTDDKTLTA